MSYIATNLRKIRTVKKLNQSQFGEIFNIKRTLISAYEQGRAEPKLDKIIEIANYFGLTIDQLVNKKLTVNEILKYKPYELFKTKNIEIPFVSKQNIKKYIKNITQQQTNLKLPTISLPKEYFYAQIAFEYHKPTDIFHNSIIFATKTNKSKKYKTLYLTIYDDAQLCLTEQFDNNAIEILEVNYLIFRDLYKIKSIDKLNQILKKVDIIHDKIFKII